MQSPRGDPWRFCQEENSMTDLLTVENLWTLAMLVLLQMVLGFDNLLYISIESKRAPEARQAMVRRVGIGLAVVLRIVLLFAVVEAIGYFQDPFVSIEYPGFVEATFNVHSLIVLLGGVFIIYTALKEILHMLSVEDIEAAHDGGRRSVATIVFWIVLMNLVFSFDSILSAMALTDVFLVMAIAIVISGALMILLANNVADFLKKNRMYEVLGLFILLIVGIMLLSEGGHIAHLVFAGFPIEPMAKSTFYFVIGVLVVIDIVQSRFRAKLMRQRERELAAAPAAH
jgi:predicted tellurium resistance membrane protein TerC